MNIATLGPRGTYSEQAALTLIKRLQRRPTEIGLHFTSVSGSLRLIENGGADYAVVPAENMIDGLIGPTFDALIESQNLVKICDEIHLPIQHCLAAAPGTDWSMIECIYSHASALGQCQNRLAESFPGGNLIPVISTAEAATIVMCNSDGKTAAICSPRMARKHEMSIFEQEIQDYPGNETRFLVCAKSDGPPTGNDRTLLAVRYGSNQPGQLNRITGILAGANINLTFIQSRPYKVKPQEYVLIFEFIGHKTEPHIQAALVEIEQSVCEAAGWKRVLGSYPKRNREEQTDDII